MHNDPDALTSMQRGFGVIGRLPRNAGARGDQLPATAGFLEFASGVDRFQRRRGREIPRPPERARAARSRGRGQRDDFDLDRVEPGADIVGALRAAGPDGLDVEGDAGLAGRELIKAGVEEVFGRLETDGQRFAGLDAVADRRGRAVRRTKVPCQSMPARRRGCSGRS